MNDSLVRLVWLVPTAFFFGFIYAALRSGSWREFLHHGLKQSFYVLGGMCGLGLVIYWMSRNL
jgi:hypothetical protein